MSLFSLFLVNMSFFSFFPANCCHFIVDSSLDSLYLVFELTKFNYSQTAGAFFEKNDFWNLNNFVLNLFRNYMLYLTCLSFITNFHGFFCGNFSYSPWCIYSKR